MKKMIDEIDISKIRNTVSNRLMNKLKILGILTVGEIYSLSVAEFQRQKSVGIKTVSEFIELKAILNTDPDSLVTSSPVRGSLKFEMPLEIPNISIDVLTDSIGNKLRKILQELHCQTIHDVVQISLEQLASQKAVGQKTIEEFSDLLNLIYNMPDAIKEEINKYSPKILPKILKDDFFENVEELLHGYFREKTNGKDRDVLAKRHGLLGNSRYTLEKLGLFYNVTRERVRQIEKRQFTKMRKLLHGEVITNPHVCVHPAITSIFTSIADELKELNFIVKNDALHRVKSRIGTNKTPSMPIFQFVLIFLGLFQYQYKGLIYFCRPNNFDHTGFNRICESILVVLWQVVKPITLSNLVIEVKKRNIGRNITFPNSIIERAISFIPYIEAIDHGGEEHFQVSMVKLMSLKDMAYRILHEKKEAMHPNEIFEEIQRRLVHQMGKAWGTGRSMKSQMVNDNRFKPIGRTGMWILSEWNQNTQLIIELIVNAFHYFNTPCSIQMILEYIVSVRDDIRLKSVLSILLQYRQKFLKLERGQYILKEWLPYYPEAKDIGGIPVGVSLKQFQSYVMDIFQKSAQSELSIQEIRQQLEKYNVFWSVHYCYIRLSKFPFLMKTKKKNKNYYSYNHEAAITNPVRQAKKADILKQSIIDEITASKHGELPLRDLVRILVNGGQIRSSIYGIINKNPDSFWKEMRDGVIYVAVKITK